MMEISMGYFAMVLPPVQCNQPFSIISLKQVECVKAVMNTWH